MSNPETSGSRNDLPDLQLPAPGDPMMHGVVRSIPFRLAVAIPVSGLKLRNLRDLKVGQVFTTAVSAAEDVPVRAGGSLLGYAELDNVDGGMAVRLTRLT